MARAPSRRLPGVRFEVRAPPLAEALPRMDVAAFVGFAASGPLHVPVPVEDPAHLSAIFGDDAPLAWDGARSEPVYAHLAPAVRAFFRNGGRRAWVVRVAGASAVANDFPLPGLLALPTSMAGASPEPAFAVARAEGSWSDDWAAATVLLARAIPARRLVEGFPDALAIDLELSAAADLAPGDLLRLTFRGARSYVLMLVVDDVAEAPNDADAPPDEEQRRVVRVRGSAGAWFSADPPGGVAPGAAATARTFRPGGPERAIAVTLASITADAVEPVVALDAAGGPDAADRAYLPGSVLRVEFAAGALFFTVDEARVVASGGADVVRVFGRGLFHLPEGPSAAERADIVAALPDVERLGFEIRLRRGDGAPVRSGELGFAAQSPLFWAALPTDTELYQSVDARAVAGRPATGRDALFADDDAYAVLRARAADPRLPLAGRGAGDVLYVPVGMPIEPERATFLGACASGDPAAVRDGLDRFEASAFLDGDLLDARTAALAAQADAIRYGAPEPRPLRGIHALFGLEEVTLVAVPDAVHRGWDASDVALPAPAPPAPPATPTVGDGRGAFAPCGLRELPAPELRVEGPNADGTFALVWNRAADDGAVYEVRESAFSDYREAVTLYTGPRTRLELSGRPPGDHYYGVRVTAGGNTSGFAAVVVRVAAARRGLSFAPDAYSPAALLAVQRALLRLCAARGDVFAALSLPEHYREAGAVAHAAALRSTLGRGADEVPALGEGEAAALSYGALYHPWLVWRDEAAAGALRRAPPDGAAVGVLARRALERGAWIAPANEDLRDVVALVPPLARERLAALKEAAVNVVRQEPRGFLVLDADTLSDDPDLVPIGVRRLLVLLRRAALRLGAIYVFEPNDAAFRRAVERGFEAMLGQMHLRGAFAGNKPEDAFRVVTDETLNPAAGRFVVDLKVAPSLPLTFLTVRLVQTGDQSRVSEVR